MVNFGPLAAEIASLVLGTPANFNGFRVFAALLHGTLVVGVSQTAALNRGRHLYFDRTAITLGISPHSSFFLDYRLWPADTGFSSSIGLMYRTICHLVCLQLTAQKYVQEKAKTCLWRIASPSHVFLRFDFDIYRFIYLLLTMNKYFGTVLTMIKNTFSIGAKFLHLPQTITAFSRFFNWSWGILFVVSVLSL